MQLCVRVYTYKLSFSVFSDPRFKGIVDKSQKLKKPVFKIDYEEQLDFTGYFKASKATTLTTATLTKYSKDKNTLPKDLHYDADKLFRLFSKSKVMVSYMWKIKAFQFPFTGLEVKDYKLWYWNTILPMLESDRVSWKEEIRIFCNQTSNECCPLISPYIIMLQLCLCTLLGSLFLCCWGAPDLSVLQTSLLW